MAIQTWRQKARELKVWTYALFLASRDPRVPWYGRLFTLCVVAYALSPIDLIPDFVPLLGYLDDLVLIPIGIALAIRMIPAPILNEHRAKAQDLMTQGNPANWVAAGVIVAIWLTLGLLAFRIGVSRFL